MAIPYASGKNFSLKLFQDNASIGDLPVKSFEINRDGTMAEDGVNGEDRNRNQFITTGFSGTIDAFVRDLKVLDKLFDQQDTEDASTAPLEVGMGLLMRPNNGTRDAVTLTEMTLGNWKLASSGMTDRAMLTIPFKARYCQKSKSL